MAVVVIIAQMLWDHLSALAQQDINSSLIKRRAKVYQVKH